MAGVINACLGVYKYAAVLANERVILLAEAARNVEELACGEIQHPVLEAVRLARDPPDPVQEPGTEARTVARLAGRLVLLTVLLLSGDSRFGATVGGACLSGERRRQNRTCRA